MKKLCMDRKRYLNKSLILYSISRLFVKLPMGKFSKGLPLLRQTLCFSLLLAEGHAVGALVHSRILLMGTHQDPVQRAVVLAVAVVSALLDGTFDALVSMAVHNKRLL